MTINQYALPFDWRAILAPEFEKAYWQDLLSFLAQEKTEGKTIYPPEGLIFNAFTHTPFDKVRVVILGQDPYHGKGQAHGLSFSVPEGVKTPSSLRNIFKELQHDLGIPPPENGSLLYWADHGVLLLNSILTVRADEPGSHARQGWETFTDQVIKTLSDRKEGLVFMLWGNYAKAKAELIDAGRHKVLMSSHPSGLSAHRGFLGCKHFSQSEAFQWIVTK